MYHLSVGTQLYRKEGIFTEKTDTGISLCTTDTDTLEAIKEFEKFKENPKRYKRYSSFSELLAEVKGENNKKISGGRKKWTKTKFFTMIKTVKLK